MSDRPGGNEPRDSGLTPVTPSSRLIFGNFVLDLRKHALFHFSERVHLTPKPVEVLETLVRNSKQGELVSKEDLLRAIWKGEFVSDNVLVQAVGEIRRALRDDRDNPVFVQTVPREGYRFIAQVAVNCPRQPANQRLPPRLISRWSASVPPAVRSLAPGVCFSDSGSPS